MSRGHFCTWKNLLLATTQCRHPNHCPPDRRALSPRWWVSGHGCQTGEALYKPLPDFHLPVSSGLCADSYSHLGAWRTETWVCILVFALQIMHLKQEFEDAIKERLFTSSYSPTASMSQHWDFSFGFSYVCTEILQKNILRFDVWQLHLLWESSYHVQECLTVK